MVRYCKLCLIYYIFLYYLIYFVNVELFAEEAVVAAVEAAVVLEVE